VAALGGTLQRRELNTLAEAAEAAQPGGAPAALVVNCSALGAARLCGDAAAMTPARGVLVLVRCPGVRDVYSDESWAGPSLAYVVPKGGDVVACGGCAEAGAASLHVSAAEAAAVVERCAALLPALRGAPVLSTWAGLRPVRAAAAGGVRLEAEASRPGAPAVVHNYGCVWGVPRRMCAFACCLPSACSVVR
jgi:D-amino-acid oxidase